jgi:YHS domain-containing protein
MKMIHSSLVATYVVVFAAITATQTLKASDAPHLNSDISGIGVDQPLLAQAETASSKKSRAKGPKLNVDQNGLMLKGYDPVAYFKQKKAVKGDPKYSSSHDGGTYYFASAEDKSTFDQSPAKYVPQYGGYCANSMTKRKLKDSDPNVFFVYKDKLYVCSSPKAAKEFNSDPDANVKKADTNWQFYQPPSNPGLRREFGS